MSATVKFDTPILRARPSRLTLLSAPSVSASGICGLGQCRSRRSTSLRRNRTRQSRAARSSSRGAKCAGQIFVVAKISLRLTPDACNPSPTSRSLLHFRGIDLPVAKAQRLLDDPRTGTPAQLPSPEAEERNLCSLRLDDRHGFLMHIGHLRGARSPPLAAQHRESGIRRLFYH